MKKLFVGLLALIVTATLAARTLDMSGVDSPTKSQNNWEAVNDALGTFINAGTALNSTASEIHRATDVSARIVTITATGSITAATNEGRVNLLGEVGGNALVTLTMPAATGSGNRYYFAVSVVNTSNYVIAANGTDTMAGNILIVDTDAQNTDGFSISGTDDKLTFDATTTGGVTIGDWVEVTDCLSTVWCVRGNLTGSGTIATPGSAT